MVAVATKTEERRVDGMTLEEVCASGVFKAKVLHHANAVWNRVEQHSPIFTRDDLISEGWLGVLAAFRRYVPGRGASFRTYCDKRVHGAVYDAVRNHAKLSRKMMIQRRELRATHTYLVAQLERQPTEQEWADAMGLSLKRFQRMRVNTLRPVPIEVCQKTRRHTKLRTDLDHGPLADMSERERIAVLRAHVRHLPDRERDVIQRHFFGGIAQNELARQMGVSDARVCQIVRHGLQSLRLKHARDEW